MFSSAVKSKYKIIPAIFICLAFFTATACFADDVEGYWKSVDEATKKATAFWHLTVKDNVLYGYLVSYPDMKPNEVCEKCKGEFKDKPQIGTPWIMLKKRSSKGVWEDGYIIDSGEGKQYTVKIWVENGRLQVRGYIAVFHKTQEWLRTTEAEAVKGF